MDTPYSLLYNAVILPVTPASAPGGQRFQVSASRTDRGTPRYVSPAWSEVQLRAAFALAGTSTLEFQELLRGNRRATGGRNPHRLLFTAEQLESMALTLDLQQTQKPVADSAERSSEADQSVFPAVVA